MPNKTEPTRATSPQEPFVDPDTSGGKVALSEKKTVRIALSSVDKDEKVSKATKDLLQDKSLMPIIWFFIIANGVVFISIVIVSMVEHFFPVPGVAPVIDGKVYIASIAGITLQTSAVIIAAFKGLFR